MLYHLIENEIVEFGYQGSQIDSHHGMVNCIDMALPLASFTYSKLNPRSSPFLQKNLFAKSWKAERFGPFFAHEGSDLGCWTLMGL
jgi:hypothetical protein